MVHVQLSTPMYGGQCTGVFVQSLLDLQGLFARHGITLSCAFMFNESLITRARNNLVHQFLETEATHLLFIDADMKFRAADILHMLHCDKDIMVAICPKKEINWGTVKDAALRGEQDLSRFTGSFVVNLLGGTPAVSVPINQPFPVAAGGTGIMLVKRQVFEKMKKKTPKFRNDMSHMKAGQEVYQFFTESIDPESKRLLSEDYHFCHQWRKMGGVVHAAPWCKIGHFGSYTFEGQLMQTDEPSVPLTLDKKGLPKPIKAGKPVKINKPTKATNATRSRTTGTGRQSTALVRNKRKGT